MNLSTDEIKAIVLQSGATDEKALNSLLTSTKLDPNAFISAIIEKGILTDEKFGALFASHYKLPFVVLSKLTISEDVFRIVPARIAKKYRIVAFERAADGIKVATSLPGNQAVLDMISRKTGTKVTAYFATDQDIESTLQIYKKVLQKTIDELLREDIQKATKQTLDEAPVIKIVDVLIEAAYQDKASDIHTEPEENASLIRFRIDGVLHDVLRLPVILHDRIINRIKVLSSLRTDEHHSAQDGKMRMLVEGDELDMRVSIVPVVGGEKVVLRLLSDRARQYTLTDLGMSDTDLAKVINAYNKSYGMILSTGPTGSGKTTSIYSILKILNTREKNITTVEDPVEYRIKGANQIQVNPKTNLTFASGLRSILRQDPNIIFVGEIRDSETAAIAVNAALTGHLVLSTLHTNDAATAIPRLIDMKVEPFLVASTVNIIIAQRLIRKICDLCKGTFEIPREEVVKNIPEEVLERYFPKNQKIIVFKGAGCKICRHTGYSGRIGLFEVLEVTKNIRKLITDKSDSDVVNQAAIKEGMKTMLEDGLDKVKRGVTTIEEVIRVTKVEFL